MMTTSKDDDSYSAVEMRLELKKKRLSRIMNKLKYECHHSIMSSSKKSNKEKRLIVIADSLGILQARNFSYQENGVKHQSSSVMGKKRKVVVMSGKNQR